LPIQDLDNRFRYHAPTTEARREAHDFVRGATGNLAYELDARLPDGREKSVAITKLEEVMFWANAALARVPDTAG
jgi:hypothetical protein